MLEQHREQKMVLVDIEESTTMSKLDQYDTQVQRRMLELGNKVHDIVNRRHKEIVDGFGKMGIETTSSEIFRRTEENTRNILGQR